MIKKYYGGYDEFLNTLATSLLFVYFDGLNF